MSGFFTIAQTGLSANPIVACFGFLLLGGTLVVGVAALVVALLRWWKPDSIPAKLSLAAGAISCAAAIAFFGDDLARPESSPIWILLLGLPALAGGLLALWVSRPAGRVWFYAFAAMLAVVVIADGGRMSLRAWRIHRAFDAAEAGQTETVMRCIASGVDIESSDEYHRTILAAAVDGGHLDTVRALLNAGANPNDCCWGMLARAVIRGDEKMVRELVERGAQPTILFWGDESLLVAARHKSSPAIVKLLEYAEHVSSPVSVVEQFYKVRLAIRETGQTSGRELEQLKPFLSDRLYGPRGEHLTSLLEGPRSFEVKRAVAASKDFWNVPVHIWYEPGTEGWEDVVVVTKERGRYVIDDILFAGAGEFDPAGRLSNSLKDRRKD